MISIALVIKKVSILLFIVVLNTPELLRIIVAALVCGKLDDRVRQHVFGHPSLPLDHLVLEVLLGSYDEEGTCTMEPEKLRKEVVGSVKDVVRSSFNRYLLHHLGVMDGCSGNMEKRRYLSFDIVESMDFYPAFLLPELSPAEDCKAEFDGCRIEGIDRSAKVENRRIFQITSEFYHIVGILFKDAIVSGLVRFCQVTKGHRIPKTEELSLAAMRLNSNYQVPQTFTSGELTEHKDFELIPA